MGPNHGSQWFQSDNLVLSFLKNRLFPANAPFQCTLTINTSFNHSFICLFNACSAPSSSYVLSTSGISVQRLETFLYLEVCCGKQMSLICGVINERHSGMPLVTVKEEPFLNLAETSGGVNTWT